MKFFTFRLDENDTQELLDTVYYRFQEAYKRKHGTKSQRAEWNEKWAREYEEAGGLLKKLLGQTTRWPAGAFDAVLDAARAISR